MTPDELRALLEKATAGPWDARIAPAVGSTESFRAWLVGTAGDAVEGWACIAHSPDPAYAYIVPAVTGNESGGRSNAQAIVALRNHAEALLELWEAADAWRKSPSIGGYAVLRAVYDALDRLEAAS